MRRDLGGYLLLSCLGMSMFFRFDSLIGPTLPFLMIVISPLGMLFTLGPIGLLQTNSITIFCNL